MGADYRRRWGLVLKLGLARRAILTLMLLWMSAGFAQEPLVQHIEPDLPIFPQYFSVVQSTDRFLYVGHGGAVARFDGARWTNIPLTQPGAVRELLVDRNGRLWVGGTNCFGYLQRQADGTDAFVDVSSGFASGSEDLEFADVWRTHEREDGIYFGALRHLFHVDFDGNPVGMWQNEGRFGAMADVDGEFWVQWRGEGLKRFRDGAFEMLPDGEAFARTLIYNLIPLDDQQVFIHSLDPRMAIWEGGEFRDLDKLTQHSDFPHLVNGIKLARHLIMFGGDDGVVRVVDLNDQSVLRLPVAPSFISGMTRDAEGAILVAGTFGLVRFQWPSPWVAFSERSGLRGEVHRVTEIGDQLFVLTGAGVYTAQIEEGSIQLPFTRLPWTGNEAWDLTQTEWGPLLAASQGLRAVDENGSSRVGPEAFYPRVFLPWSGDSNRLWVGTEHGAALIERELTGWRLAGRDHDFGTSIGSLAPASSGSAWAGSAGKGLFLISAGNETSSAFSATAVGPEMGVYLDSSRDAVVSQTSEGAIVSTGETLARWDGQKFDADGLEDLASLREPGEILSFAESERGELWAHSYRSLYQRINQSWLRHDLASLNRGAFEAFSVGKRGNVWLGGSSILLKLDPTKAAGVNANAALNLTGIAIDGADGVERRDLAKPLALAGGGADVRFEYGLTDYAQAKPPMYRHRLLGLDDGWTRWSDSADVDYYGLRPGKYTLQAQALSSLGVPYQAEALSFEVQPRWFESQIFRVALVAAFVLLLMATVYALQRRKLAQLAISNRALEEAVKSRTEELREANDRLRSQAEQDSLTGVGNRRFFDRRLASAMKRSQDNAKPLSLLMIDVDYFKKYNDTHGHHAGDLVLRTLAETLSRGLRTETVVARYGGEEFAVIAEQCDGDAARKLADRLVGDVEREMGGTTISIGFATYDRRRDAAPENLVERADSALYESKHAGRNRATLAA